MLVKLIMLQIFLRHFRDVNWTGCNQGGLITQKPSHNLVKLYLEHLKQKLSKMRSKYIKTTLYKHLKKLMEMESLITIEKNIHIKRRKILQDFQALFCVYINI